MIQYPINPYNIFRLRYYSIEGYLPLPPTKYAYVGGMGSLRGYDSKEFKGSYFNIYNLEYERNFYIKKLKNTDYVKIGLLFFIDYAEIRSLHTENYSWKDALTSNLNYDYEIYKTSIGFGINWGEIRYIVAKRMDRSVNDWSFVFQFHTLIDREYPYPN